MKKWILVILVVALLVLIVASAIAHDGCTPGYWKNNPAAWSATSFNPETTLAVAFPGVTPASWTKYGIDSADTMLEALKYGGGPGLHGAAKMYLRTAVASLLNAAHPLLGFTQTPAWVQDTVAGDLNVAYCYTGPGQCTTEAGLREALLGRKTLWDSFNNEACTVDAHGNPIDGIK